MIIGVDLDNTIVCYDALFHHLASERVALPRYVTVSKQAVRDFLRHRDQEVLWTELQGIAYGARMSEAVPFAGVEEFLAHCRRQRIEVFVISHRTQFPFLGDEVDLHEAARRWLEDHRVLSEENRVFLELTRQDKMARISSVGCDWFVDDLPEFLCDQDFPPGVRRILFDPRKQNPDHAEYHRAESWRQIGERVFSSA